MNSTVSLHVNSSFKLLIFLIVLAGQRRADVTVEVAAEAETETDTETEIGTGTGIATGTETETETGSEDIVPGRAPGPGLAPEIVIVTEIKTETETVAKEETSRPAGRSVHRAPGRTRTETATAGRTNTWTGRHQRSLLLETSTTAKSPASCSLDALFSWRV